MNLAKFALRNPVTILMAVLMAVILGAISFSKMPVDMFPEITFPSITVATFYKGAPGRGHPWLQSISTGGRTWTVPSPMCCRPST
jgi:AcrB/AcrD/AcrF family